MEGPEAPTSHLASGSTSPTWAAQLRDGRGRPAEGRGQAEPRANGMGSTAQAPKVAAQCTPTMSQRPPRNFRRRQADSGSSSDPDLDPEPSPDSGLTGRASERASGASGSRGRARVWATSRRAETRPAPKREAQDFSGNSGDSAGRLSDPPRAPAHADFLPLSGSPRQRGLALKGSSDSDSEDEPDPRGQATSCSSEGPDAASSEEEAQDAWETQQMRKALRVPGGGPASGLCHVPTGPAGKRVSDWAGSFPPVSLESIKKQLSSRGHRLWSAGRLASLEDVHRCHQREYECRRQDADSARKAVAALQEAPDPAPTYAFYRSLKDYLAVLLDCLSEKTAAIEALESALRALLRDRAASRLKRRQEELRSEAAHLQQLAARSTDCAPDAPGLCEQAAARRSQGSRPQPREGPSSEEEPEEEADLRDRQGDISRRGHRVFEDVGEDFSDSRKILLRFEQWRERFPDSYRDAYASLCLPKLLGPFIRLQMLDWNPLECMAWFQSVQEFAGGPGEDGPDGGILPAALDKTVLPYLTGFVRCLWDPLSTSQTRSLVQRCREVLGLRAAAGGGTGLATQDLMDSVVWRLKRAIEEDVFIPLYPKRVVEDRALPHAAFQERQFWSAVKLWNNILLWDGLVLDDTLQELALDKLLNRYLVVALSNASPAPDVLDKYRRVVESLPESWLGAGSCIPRLASLAQALARAAQQLHDQDAGLGSAVRDLVLLLVKMKALAQARAFVERNGLAALSPHVAGQL
ncbi:intron Large complex component GCFC2 isoform X2 [Monodelphis domestica]|uniref:intron Large complex component GCFC2 isoform X2 n=1 Tax=Monodelphis domestica TaxID=13616 RepID=UPI0024E2368A|nr:intron Large complex component GCFC2 isoform X2 [Monodelphis domestica]